MKGRLLLVATPIGNLGDLSPRATEALAGADLIACEDTRHTRKLLTHAGITGRPMLSVHDANEGERVPRILGLLAQGRQVALVSDAGTPAISDPGQHLVAEAITAGHEVVVIPGPSAGVAALVASGLPTARWVFEGFLPRSGGERTRRLAEVAAERRTIVLYEAPHRVRRTVDDLCATCGPTRRVALARELTKMHEEVWRGTLGDASVDLAATEPRGEFTIVLEGAPEEPPASDEKIAAALTERMAGGDSRRRAVEAVTAELALPRRRVYDIALGLAGS
ncbi:MAG TPA: 16S rRNA (cytidine(1402)-2'-O)-methyltransferase [Acidimicrobiales bacterium]|nr:16S rRNA (cytidine(1402)-2'-O)-methyltransferase [Acidimicrobiales bacterium]